MFKVSSSAVRSVLAAFDEKNVFYNLYDPFNRNDYVVSSEFVKLYMSNLNSEF